ncbi:MAG: Hsp20/alpha crystallin family protein [Candidatus Omnitrophota bacterium]
MALTIWRPFGDLLSLNDRVTRFMENETDKHPIRKGTGLWFTGYPVMDIYETKDAYTVRVEVPGMKKEDIHIEFSDGTLTVSGERKEDGEVKREDYLRNERFIGTFNRSVSFNGDIDANHIKASMDKGILHLQISKSEGKKAVTIPINA